MLNVDVLQISTLMVFFQLYVIYKKLYKSSPFPIGKSKFLRFIIRLFIICSQYTFSITYINYSPFFSLSHFTHYPPYCPSTHTHTHTKPLTSIYTHIYTSIYIHTHTLPLTHIHTPPNHWHPCTYTHSLPSIPIPHLTIHTSIHTLISHPSTHSPVHTHT